VCRLKGSLALFGILLLAAKPIARIGGFVATLFSSSWFSDVLRIFFALLTGELMLLAAGFFDCL
jgi:hypothetical protein